jgi:predicted Zn-dependent protease
MKKLHPEKVQHSMDNDQEAVVRESAETSNSRQPVLTEAMAEVYLKQGSREKAVEIYEKLSLLDPSKSAYFAVLINEIKEK